jgi:hypothetical protein
MNILDPQGLMGTADKTILIDSLAIMLAIVLPTIVAVFGFAYWFRASNPKARYLPHWEYSGRIELVVWSIPTLTVRRKCDTIGLNRRHQAVRSQRDLVADHQVLAGIGEGGTVANQHLPGIPRLQIEHHQAALAPGIGKISVIVQGIDPHIVQGVLCRDHALEIIFPDRPVGRHVFTVSRDGPTLPESCASPESCAATSIPAARKTLTDARANRVLVFINPPNAYRS